jgi:hypothetical protein
MKRVLAKKIGRTEQEELSSEYRFGYNNAKPSRFAGPRSGGVIAVVLDRDVAAVFKSSKSVNRLLRPMISGKNSKRKLLK